METIISNYTAALPSSSPSKLLLHSSSKLSFRSSSAAVPPSRRTPGRSIKAYADASAPERRRSPLSEGWNPMEALESAEGLSTGPPRTLNFEELDAANMLLKQRVVFLGSQVDTMTADLIISQLLFLDAEDRKKDIKLFINSPGGSVTAGMGIYDAMKLCQADVSTVCFGLAASMGAFLLAAGTKGKRYCMPNARVMIHQPLGTAGGRTIDMGLQIKEMMYHRVKMNKIMSRITGKPEHQIENDTDWDYFMNPWEAKEYGLVDVVIDDGKPGLIAPVVDSAPPPKTRVWSLWKVEGTKKAKRNLPSEMRIPGSSDKEKGSEDAKEAQAPLQDVKENKGMKDITPKA